MGDITYLGTGIASNSAIIAANISTNFNAITAQVNGNLDSDNLVDDAVISQKIANNAIVAAKISASQIENGHIKYVSSDGGVQLAQIGSAPPLGGVILGRYSHTMAIATNVTSASHVLSWNQAIDGNPGFTDTPTPNGVIVNVGATDTEYTEMGFQDQLFSINSAAASIHYSFGSCGSGGAGGTDGITATAYVNAWGPK